MGAPPTAMPSATAKPPSPSVPGGSESLSASGHFKAEPATQSPNPQMADSHVRGDYGEPVRERSWEGTPTSPHKPWLDQSGERQKITQKRMELEVKKVEEAHDRAISIITKSDGHTVSEDLQVSDSGKSRSRIVAQVPVDRIDGVVAQLRELGKVKILTGESEDVTKEYYGRGEDIREAGSSEDELVAKYEAEKDPAAKRMLYNQIQSLRAANKQGKRTLGELSEKTHYALLDLTLVEAAGPGAFVEHVAENSAIVGGWLLATAIIWLPVAVIAWLVWRRRRP
jgi:hypothetical protein